MLIGFHDDLEENTFGTVKKGKYCPSSDFRFDLVAEVICDCTSSSGYMIDLTPANTTDTRYFHALFCPAFVTIYITRRSLSSIMWGGKVSVQNPFLTYALVQLLCASFRLFIALMSLLCWYSFYIDVGMGVAFQHGRL